MLWSNLIWFLLPLAAACGWFAALGRDMGGNRKFWNYSQRFHEEINQLLSESESDKQVFDSFTDGGRDAAETHIALGNLYRRRGEFDRAIRIHESIMAKHTLDQDVRVDAQFEVARDYEAAGLTDRSEAQLRELIQSGHRLVEAYDSLLKLHESEQDWLQAVTIALEYKGACDALFAQKSVAQKSVAQKLSHYYCELAELASADDNDSEARRLLTQALRQWPASARAHAHLADIALREKNYKQAVAHFTKVESIDAALMPVIIEKLFAALHGVGDKQALERFVRRIQQQKNAYSVIQKTRQVIAEQAGEQLADRFFKDQILKRPSLKGLRDWVHDQIALSKPDEKAKVQIICNLLDQVMEDKPAYRCRSCGFQGNVMHWRCPSCASWDSVSTIIGVEGE